MTSTAAELVSGPSGNTNWRIVTLLLLMGAVPALPGVFIVGEPLAIVDELSRWVTCPWSSGFCEKNDSRHNLRLDIRRYDE